MSQSSLIVTYKPCTPSLGYPLYLYLKKNKRPNPVSVSLGLQKPSPFQISLHRLPPSRLALQHPVQLHSADEDGDDTQDEDLRVMTSAFPLEPRIDTTLLGWGRKRLTKKSAIHNQPYSDAIPL